MTSVPRILVTIPHYYSATGDRRYGSTYQQPPARAEALSRAVASLHQSLGTRQSILHFETRTTHPANHWSWAEIDIVVVTAGDAHLIDHLSVPGDLYTHERTSIDNPLLLGFECHRVLRDRFGTYDWYAYMEDDLIIQDPLFLLKLEWFLANCGEKRLLLPNRFELSACHDMHKAYIDGDFTDSALRALYPKGRLEKVEAAFLGRPLVLELALNPHAGMFFLSAGQMGAWAAAPHFLDRDISFIGPLESAATYGMLRTFHVFKPHLDNASFLEVLHAGEHFLSSIGEAFTVTANPPPRAPV